MLSLQDAFDRLLAQVTPLGTREVPAEEAAGRVAARDIDARGPVPDFPRAMMDGYAVRAGDVETAAPDAPERLRVSGRRVAGEVTSGGPGPGEAWHVATGAPLPGAADGVVPYEWTRPAGSVDAGRSLPTLSSRGPGVPVGREVLVRRPLGDGPRGRNVAPPGEDVREGSCVVERGTALDPARLAVLGALGVDRVTVHRRPRVAVVATGTEVVPAGAPRRPGQIRDANTPFLAAAVAAAGGEPLVLAPVPDEGAALREALRSAAAMEPDLVLTTGGVSVGPRDLVADAWRELGAGELFHGVAIKPGKPVFAGEMRGALVLSLSGTPAACVAAFRVLVGPALLRLGGRRRVMPDRLRVRVREAYPKAADMTRLLWARFGDPAAEAGAGGPSGRAVPADAPDPPEPGQAPDGAASLAPTLQMPRLEGMAAANGMLVMPPGDAPWAAGDVVTGFRFDRPETRAGFEFR